MDDAHGESEFDWDPLIELISQGGVIPIVGPDLITVESDGKAVPLYALLAARLAARLKLNGEAGQLATLNQVAACHLERGGDLERVYSSLKAVMPADADLAVPEPLSKLARITPLKLFVSTTFDNLLERAINAERFDGRPETRVIAYSYQHPCDLPCPLQELKTATVFQLMGRLSAVAYEYAVTEEDMLEFLHSLQSGGRSPNNLFDELNRNHVVIIGSGFSDWLARFFIRLAKNDRLWMAHGATTIADQRALDDSALLDFLRHYSKRTRCSRPVPPTSSTSCRSAGRRTGRRIGSAPGVGAVTHHVRCRVSQLRQRGPAGRGSDLRRAPTGPDPGVVRSPAAQVGRPVGEEDQSGPQQVLAVRADHLQAQLHARGALLPRGMGRCREGGPPTASVASLRRSRCRRRHLAGGGEGQDGHARGVPDAPMGAVARRAGDA
jgi:hypothetical protein